MNIQRWSLLSWVLLVGACGHPTEPPTDAVADVHVFSDAAFDAAPDPDAAPDLDAGSPPCEAPGYFAPHAARFSSFNLPDPLNRSADVGVGLDLDNDPTTCRPHPQNWYCGGGVDNQITTLDAPGCAFNGQDLNVSGFNIAMDWIMGGGTPVSFLLEARDLTMDASNNSVTPFTLVLHDGQWLASAECPQSDSVGHPGQRCDYLSSSRMFAPGSCEPLSTIPDAEIIDGRLVAGGPAHTVWIVYSVLGLSAGIVLHQARIEADVDVTGDNLTLNNGIIAGAICNHELIHVLAPLTGDSTQCDPANLTLEPDLEIGCSAAEPDAISAGFVFQAHPARIVGLLRE